MKYRVRHTTTYSYAEPVPISYSQVRLAPREIPNQQCIRHRLLVHPAPADRGRRVDYCGNLVDYFSINEPHRSLKVSSQTQVEVLPSRELQAAESLPWEQVATDLKTDRSPAGLDAYQFAFDSPQVKASAALADFARPSFSAGRPVLEAARELTHRIFEAFTYDPKATAVQTRLGEVLEHRRGVCQDFAHIEIGCLRSLGLAARYVSGYLRTEPPAGQARLVGADASHAWVSVYAGAGRGWVALDPTNDVTVDTDHVTVAWGRDYHDVCPIQGVSLGGGRHQMTVAVDVVPVR